MDIGEGQGTAYEKTNLLNSAPVCSVGDFRRDTLLVPASRLLRRRCRSEGLERSPYESCSTCLCGLHRRYVTPGFLKHPTRSSSKQSRPHYKFNITYEQNCHGLYNCNGYSNFEEIVNPYQIPFVETGDCLMAHDPRANFRISPNRSPKYRKDSSGYVSHQENNGQFNSKSPSGKMIEKDDSRLPKVEELFSPVEFMDCSAEVTHKQPLKSILNNSLDKNPQHGILKKNKPKNEVRSAELGRRRQRALSESEFFNCAFDSHFKLNDRHSPTCTLTNTKRVKDNSGSGYSHGTPPSHIQYMDTKALSPSNKNNPHYIPNPRNGSISPSLKSNYQQIHDKTETTKNKSNNKTNFQNPKYGKSEARHSSISPPPRNNSFNQFRHGSVSPTNRAEVKTNHLFRVINDQKPPLDVKQLNKSNNFNVHMAVRSMSPSAKLNDMRIAPSSPTHKNNSADVYLISGSLCSPLRNTNQTGSKYMDVNAHTKTDHMDNHLTVREGISNQIVQHIQAGINNAAKNVAPTLPVQTGKKIKITRKGKGKKKAGSKLKKKKDSEEGLDRGDEDSCVVSPASTSASSPEWSYSNDVVMTDARGDVPAPAPPSPNDKKLQTRAGLAFGEFLGLVPDNLSASMRESLFPRVPPYLKFVGHDAKVPLRHPVAIQKHLKWKLTTITPIVVKKTLINSGWKLVKSECETSECPQEETVDWLGIWGKHMKSFTFRGIKDGQKMNHFPGTFQIGRKDRLWRNLQRLSLKHGTKEFGIMPKTYVLPHDLRLLKHDWDNYVSQGEKWIIKPPASARGTGIKVVSRWTQIPKRRPVVVQRYVAKPYLINGSKFDMRLYVLVTSMHPLRIYLFNDGLARFASVKYSEEASSLHDRYMHLTNYSINRLSKNYTTNEDANACQGHKWTLRALMDYLKKDQGINVDELWLSMKDLVIKTILSGESSISSLTKANIASRYNCYELFGIDVLLDENLKPWLLEVNISPSLHSASPLDLHVKGPLVTSVLNLAQFQIPSKVNLENICKKNNPYLESLPYDSRLYTMYLSKDERDKHIQYTKVEDRCDYLDHILDSLTPDDVRHLIQAEDEFTQVHPGLERIFPTRHTHHYHDYMSGPRYYNHLFDAWENKYSDKRAAGIKLLSSLCEVGYHLELPPQPLKNDVDTPEEEEPSLARSGCSGGEDAEAELTNREEVTVLTAQIKEINTPPAPAPKVSPTNKIARQNGSAEPCRELKGSRLSKAGPDSSAALLQRA